MLEFCPFPLDFAAACPGPDGLEVRHFEAGSPVETPRSGTPLVLCADAARETLRSRGLLQTWQAAGAVCVSAERVLALVAPEEPQPEIVGALDLGARWTRAVRGVASQSEVLRVAASVLPANAMGERWILQRALGNLALDLSRAREAGPQRGEGVRPGSAPRRGPLADPDWREVEPHELLDRALRHLLEWKRDPSALAFEPRPSQVEMAHAVLEALSTGGTLVVEAGTGVGKTIAYALPALLHSARTGARFLLSTHTRNLQQQLASRDLPELWECFDVGVLPRADGEGQGLRFAKLVGRSNYVCKSALRRLARAASEAGGSFQVAQLLLWTLRGSSGELDELAGRDGFEPRFLWELGSRREVCLGGACRGDDPCPVYAAREAARRADLVVVNHALLFSDGAAEGNILGRHDGIVVDESHNLVTVATESSRLALGRSSAEALVAPLGRLNSELRALAGDPAVQGLVLRLERHGARIGEVRKTLVGFLETLEAAMPRGGPARTRQRYRDGDEVFGAVRGDLRALLGELEACARDGLALEEECRALVTQDLRWLELGGVLELLAALQRETRAALEFLSTGESEDWAFYLDFGADGAKLREIAAAPLDVATEVQRVLAAPGRGAVYTSATLAVGEDFQYFRSRAGVGAGAQELCVPSPFDYTSQCLVLQAQHLSNVAEPAFEAQAGEILAAIASRTRRRTLVLLTSHAALRRLHADLLARLGPRAPLLAQDVSGSRERLMQRFAREPGAVLLGTSSFWEGVDFPGESLEVLAIAKLPFQVPDEPIVAARSERLRARGEDPFGDYMLPEAVLRFKQGFGRLIRSRQDRGVVLLLDGRLGDRGYGVKFLRALPVAPEVCHDSETLVERAVEWLSAPAGMSGADAATRGGVERGSGA